MKIKKYFAKDIRQALEMARQEQGPEVVILSNRKVLGGIELITSNDYQPEQGASGVVNAVSGLSHDSIPALTHKEVTDNALWSSEPVINQMQDELKSLRSLLEQQMSGLAWGAMGRQHPLWAALLRELGRLNLSPQIARELVEEIPEENKFDQAWRKILALLSYQIPVLSDDFLTPDKCILFIGPSGSGKTTTIAKLATQYVLSHRPADILLATTDTYRVGAREQLRSYARILGVPMRTISNAGDFASLFEIAAQNKLILIDTAGLSVRDNKHREQLALLQKARGKAECCLIIPATDQSQAIRQQLMPYLALQPNYCIPTKLDEATTLGTILSYAIEHYLPIASICDGQAVPEDIQTVSPQDLIARAACLMKNQEGPYNENLVEQSMGKYEYQRMTESS